MGGLPYHKPILTMKFLFYVSIAYSFEILRPLQKAIIEAGGEVRWYIGDKGLKSFILPDEIQLDSIRSVMEFSPLAIFVPGNRVPFFFPGLKVQVFHGFGIEKKGHFRIRNFFDLYCTHGELTTKRFQKLAIKHPHFRVIETGWPKVDPLFEGATTPSKHTTILYAPTFSPSLTSIPALFPAIKNLIEQREWHWVIKFHPKTVAELRTRFDSLENARVSIKDTEDILPIMQRCDVMISDTSSVITEFMLLNKPVIAFNNLAPASHLKNITNPDDLEATVIEAIEQKSAWLQRQSNFIEQMHPYRDGRSSQRVLQATLDVIADNGITKISKPLNLLRNLKLIFSMRKALFEYLMGR